MGITQRNWMIWVGLLINIIHLDIPQSYAITPPEKMMTTLASSPHWRRLMHYQTKTWTNQWESEVSTPSFFIHPQGAYSPLKELKALYTLLTQELNTSSSLILESSSITCRFPARSAWLVSYIGLDQQFNQALQTCPYFQTWLRAYQTHEVWLIWRSWANRGNYQGNQFEVGNPGDLILFKSSPSE